MEILKLKASEKERKKIIKIKKLYKNRKVYRLCRSTLKNRDGGLIERPYITSDDTDLKILQVNSY